MATPAGPPRAQVLAEAAPPPSEVAAPAAKSKRHEKRAATPEPAPEVVPPELPGFLDPLEDTELPLILDEEEFEDADLPDVMEFLDEVDAEDEEAPPPPDTATEPPPAGGDAPDAEAPAPEVPEPEPLLDEDTELPAIYQEPDLLDDIFPDPAAADEEDTALNERPPEVAAPEVPAASPEPAPPEEAAPPPEPTASVPEAPDSTAPEPVEAAPPIVGRPPRALRRTASATASRHAPPAAPLERPADAHDPEAAPLLAGILSGDVAAAQATALRTLGLGAGDAPLDAPERRQVLDTLIYALTNKNPQMRLGAAQGLICFGPGAERALVKLEAILDDPACAHPAFPLAFAAAGGAPLRALGALRRMLSSLPEAYHPLIRWHLARLEATIRGGS